MCVVERRLARIGTQAMAPSGEIPADRLQPTWKGSVYMI
jgi:hypothetical protein